MQQNTHEHHSLGTINWSVRGLPSWMQVVTLGKGTLGQVMVKGRGVNG